MMREEWSATRVLFYGALLFGLASFGVAEVAGGPAALLSWFIELSTTLIAAALAVAGGVWLFHYQDRETEEKLEKKLAARVAVELQENLKRLEEQPETFTNRQTREALGPPVLLVPLSTVALRDWMRSKVLEPKEVMAAMKFEGRINAHNKQVEVLWSQWSAGTPGLANRPEVRLMTQNLAVRQESLKDDFREDLQRLRDRGIEVPD